jgi:hypothetical protein
MERSFFCNFEAYFSYGSLKGASLKDSLTHLENTANTYE